MTKELFLKTLILLFLLAGPCFEAFAQRNLLDSLLKVNTAHTTYDTKKIEILNQLSFWYVWFQMDSGIVYADQAIALSQKLKNQKQLASAYNNKSPLLFNLGRWKEAEDVAQKSLLINNALNNKAAMAENYLNLSMLKTGNEKKVLLDKSFALFSAVNDSNGIAKVLLSYSDYFRYSDLEIALDYVHKALGIFRRQENRLWIAIACNSMGQTYSLRSEHWKAIDYIRQALRIASRIGNPFLMHTSYWNLGSSYDGLTDYPKSIENYIAALKLAELIKNKVSEAGLLSNIGYVYISLNDNNNALKYLNMGLTRAIEIGNKEYVAINHNNLGEVYLKRAEYNIALQQFKISLEKSEEIKNEYIIYNNLECMARTYEKLNDYGNAFVCLKKFDKLTTKVKDPTGEALGLRTEAVVIKNAPDAELIKVGLNPANRMKYIVPKLLRCIEMTGKTGEIDIKRDALNDLSNFYENIGNVAKSFEFYKQYILLKDSIINSKNTTAVANLQMQYEYDNKEVLEKAEQEKKDAVAQKELQKQKLVRNGFVGGFAVVLLFATVFFAQRNKIKKGKKRSDELLLNILPEEVAEELKAKGSADAKQFDDVTVMFTDFKNFTQISEKLSPTELVNEIHTCFKAFDNIITKYNIEKIKTIGDAYMCAGGLPVANKTHANDVVKASLEIQKFMLNHLQQRKNQGKEVFEIRIGIHTGPVVAGIVGVKKFAYDIWGDTVNIASRMESSGEAGKVNISGTTYQLVNDKFICAHRGKIEAKNKGEIDMYFVERSI